MTTLVDPATGQVLGIDGRDNTTVGHWLTNRTPAWRERIETVAIDFSAAFRKALRARLPHQEGEGQQRQQARVPHGPPRLDRLLSRAR